MNLKFDEEKHEYTSNGNVLPSVTEICSPISFEKLDALPKIMLKRASERGTAVHEQISNFIITEEYDLDSMEMECVPYFCAFMNWWKTYNPTPLFSELIVGGEELGYAGTCDFVCEIDGKTVLIDFKTSSTLDKKSLSVQLYGYKKALEYNGIKIDGTFGLHLKNDGKFSFPEIECDEEWWNILFRHNQKMRSKYGQSNN